MFRALYHSTQFNTLIPNIVLLFFQSAIWIAKNLISDQKPGFFGKPLKQPRKNFMSLRYYRKQDTYVEASGENLSSIGRYPFVAFRIYGTVWFWARFTGKVSRKFLEKLLYIYGSMQLDELIPNITFFFLESVTPVAKAGFPIRDFVFWASCKIVQERFHEFALLP